MLINLQGEYAIVYNEKLWGENTICCADVLCDYNNHICCKHCILRQCVRTIPQLISEGVIIFLDEEE
jgi:hypothetical protein